MDSPNKKKVLGKGLSALLGDAAEEARFQSTYTPPPVLPAETTIGEIPIDSIETNPFQPRLDFDPEHLADLAESIRAQGVIQPITVRKLGPGSYQLISGERRFQASKLVGLTQIPAYVRTANDEQMLEMALIENVQRHDLNPIEVALAYQRLMDECKLVIEQVAEKIGKKRPTINNYLRLLKLPPDLQAALRDNRISMGHARALITIDNPVIQLDILKDILENDLSVRAVEDLVRKIGQPKQVINKEPKKTDNSLHSLQIQEVQKNLASKLGTKVQISSSEDGKGEIKIRFFSEDDLNRLIELLS